MKKRGKKIALAILSILFILFLIFVLSFYRYNIFTDQDIKTDSSFRLLQMYNSIFHPFLRTGEKTRFYDKNENILRTKLIYDKGKLVEIINYYNNGQISNMTPIKYCSEHGTVKYFYENGSLHLSIEYKYGFLDGKAIVYHLNGQVLKEISYKKDVIHGDYVGYDSTGYMLKKIKYQNGEIIK